MYVPAGCYNKRFKADKKSLCCRSAGSLCARPSHFFRNFLLCRKTLFLRFKCRCYVDCLLGNGKFRWCTSSFRSSKTNIVGCDDSLRAKVLIIEDGKNEKNPNDKLDNGLSWSGAYQRTIINPFNHGEKYVKN